MLSDKGGLNLMPPFGYCCRQVSAVEVECQRVVYVLPYYSVLLLLIILALLYITIILDRISWIVLDSDWTAC